MSIVTERGPIRGRVWIFARNLKAAIESAEAAGMRDDQWQLTKNQHEVGYGSY